MMKLLKTTADYQAVLKRLEAVFDAKPNTPQGDKLEKRCLLIENYEDEHFPIHH